MHGAMIQSLRDLPILFSPADALALALLLAVHVIVRWLVEHPPASRPSVSALMSAERRAAHREMALRDNRIPDTQAVASLRQGASFFASAALIALGGGAALLGQAERLRDVAGDLGAGTADPVVVWELKILVLLMILAMAFLKFLWAIRIYGYAMTLMMAVPQDGTTPRAQAIAARAAELGILADRSFARGLRGVYFTLAACGWFAGALPLALAALAVGAMLLRQEFASDTRDVLMARLPD
jgi:uncharacterized membrane protein